LYYNTKKKIIIIISFSNHIIKNRKYHIYLIKTRAGRKDNVEQTQREKERVQIISIELQRVEEKTKDVRKMTTG